MEEEVRSDFVQRCLVVTVAVVVSTVSALTILVLFGRPFISDHVIKVVPWLEHGAFYVVSGLATVFAICLIGSILTYLYYSRPSSDDDVDGSLKKDE